MAEYTLPAENQGQWTPGTDVGITGGIDQYLAGGVSDRAVSGNAIDVTQSPYNADNTGVSDVKAAVSSALSDAVAGDVVYFPAGTYLFATGGVSTGYKDDITIRGAGVGVTTFHASTTQPVFSFNSPGAPTQDTQIITGAKTKGTSVLTVADASAFAAGEFYKVSYENEVDNTRIQNGAAPVWNSRGFTFSRTQFGKITATTGTTITVDPPLPADGTNLVTKIEKYQLSSQSWRTEGWGFEDFSVTFDAADHTSQFISVNTASECWFYNIDFEDWSKNDANGSCIKLSDAYKCEIRKCRFTATSGASSDGAIETVNTSSLLIVDNIIEGDFGSSTYESGGSNNNVIAYNFTEDNTSYHHNAHPSLNIFEGNVGKRHQSDGYHGSSSHNTFYRNWFQVRGGVVLNRFKRNYVITGNLLGTDGIADGAISWGNPNIGNGNATGFAGPTGLSDQEGEIDYSQPGYGHGGGSPNTYVIQESDISVGDFWNDWEVTGTLTTRTSDTEGVFAMSGGDWSTSLSLISIWWNSKGSVMHGGNVTNVSGTDITISWSSGSLPVANTAVQVYFFSDGWQERDLDVQASSETTENYFALASGTGSIQDGTADTLPASFVYSAKPDWFGNLTWPPIDPDSPSFDETIIPAGYRYVNGNEDYLNAGSITANRLSVNTLRIG